MLKIQVLSDLHLEFDRDHAKQFIDMLDPDGIDVLVLAGDICANRQIVAMMQLLCQRYSCSDVVWVHGNHEFYGTDRPSTISQTQEALRQNKNLHWLDCSSKVIRGQRFVGATLWFADGEKNAELEKYMNDFYVIADLKQWVYTENARATAFLKKTTNSEDIVITHHLPSVKSVAPRFSISDLNAFFVCDMEQFIELNGPKLWIHGHTHDSFDYGIPHRFAMTSTRIVCNPRGYWPNDLNPDFEIDKRIVI